MEKWDGNGGRSWRIESPPTQLDNVRREKGKIKGGGFKGVFCCVGLGTCTCPSLCVWISDASIVHCIICNVSGYTVYLFTLQMNVQCAMYAFIIETRREYIRARDQRTLTVNRY